MTKGIGTFAIYFDSIVILKTCFFYKYIKQSFSILNLIKYSNLRSIKYLVVDVEYLFMKYLYNNNYK